MKPFAPDIGDPFPKPKPKPTPDSGANNNGSSANNMPAFQPGQLGSLAGLLSRFGGTPKDWKSDLRDTYDRTSMSDFNFGGGHGGRSRGGNNNNGGGKSSGSDPKPGDGGFDPSSPRNRAMPIASQMPMQMPQMGLLSAGPMQAQQPQQTNPMGDIPPEVLAFIRTRGV